uniref:Placenta-specific gene 8 protein n=1 Tax=Sus scrofa TaxID=9823 RepID=A0A480GC60_PIG
MELLTISCLERMHGSPSVDVSLDLAKRTHRAAERHHKVITNGPRDAVASPVEGPHCDTRSTQAAFVQVRCNLNRQAREAKYATETDAAVAEAIAQACLPVGGLRDGATSGLSHNDHWSLSLHFGCRILSGCGS